jgi:hypothetical protein
MTDHPPHPLADAIAKAIFATVEKDRCLNLENIREAAFRELAVAEAKQSFPAGLTASDDIRRRAQELVDLMLSDAGNRSPNYYSREIADAHNRLYEALRK